MMRRLELAVAYDAALRRYLVRPDEDARMAAYDLGRTALAEDLGLFDIAAIHRSTLETRLGEPGTDAGAIAISAQVFLQEVLAPFEMAFRGYVDTNEELRHRTEELVYERESVLATNRELEAFSYSVSHDLRAPLRAIGGFCSILVEDHAAQLDADGTRWLVRIQHNVEKMNRLIDDLLSLSRVARGELARGAVDLGALAARVVERLRAADPERVVVVSIEQELVADGDPGLLAVVIENLVANAWKFTSKRASAEIAIGARREGGAPVFFVRDDGAGFDMAQAKRLFGAFQRLHLATDFEGTGIGLATVQRIIHRHGGRVWADARPDEGATFSFTLGVGRPSLHAPERVGR